MEITTLRTSCAVGRQCEGIHRIDTDPDGLYVITKKVTDPEILAAFADRVGPDEQLGRTTRALIPEV